MLYDVAGSDNAEQKRNILLLRMSFLQMGYNLAWPEIEDAERPSSKASFIQGKILQVALVGTICKVVRAIQMANGRKGKGVKKGNQGSQEDGWICCD